MHTPRTALCWLRRDLRLADHAALAHAQGAGRVLAAFVFDPAQLSGLARDDARVALIWHSLLDIRQRLRALGSDLAILHGDPADEIPLLAARAGAHAVFAARDYEPAARARDARVAAALATDGRALELVKDQVVFDTGEVLTRESKPYTVFTPYARAWRAKLAPADAGSLAVRLAADAFLPWREDGAVTLATLGFTDNPIGRAEAGEAAAAQRLAAFEAKIDDYHAARDYPARDATSQLSAALRFGTVSIRTLTRTALAHDGAGAQAWLNELVWRDFYQQLLWHFPHAATESFKPAFRDLPWPGEDSHFDAWRAGQTGYPLIDAAMRELLQTGWMHNRLRMVVASFLVKDLLIDWRRGEAHFAHHLLDYDLAANNGGWQWAASTGCDAQPWFRIFNPVTQSQKFDPDGAYIRRWVPGLAALDARSVHAPWQAKALPAGFALGRDYPVPIVDHAAQRERALALYGKQP
ncbi:cryptochrome/photolyase family protein [Crenobacter caeni]|uniref:Deoxyribodipyrimidine photo-lyase n=1 Tax=Crenobacter caeni TaxID=2705474 RepID=A0A6B2KT52_9NEIS|nr:deoxyribodipyrimidine photo-lyase [Crenobacter caeni]NDV13328.1 deoxyribodipyrimidine photo-lyase [Crenobacter caeni]